MTNEQTQTLAMALEYDLPYCEVCGEDHATLKTLECAMCDDCFENATREALEPLLGRVCASVSRSVQGNLRMCLQPSGIEHDHD